MGEIYKIELFRDFSHKKLSEQVFL